MQSTHTPLFPSHSQPESPDSQTAHLGRYNLLSTGALTGNATALPVHHSPDVSPTHIRLASAMPLKSKVDRESGIGSQPEEPVAVTDNCDNSTSPLAGQCEALTVCYLDTL